MTSANVLNNKESCGGMVYKLLEFHDSENINLKKASIFHELARLISEKTFGFHMVHPLFMYLNGYDLPPPMDFPITPPFPPEMRVGEFPMIAADWETVDECFKALRELEKSLTLPEEQVEVPRFDGKQLLQTYLLENQEDYMASEILFNEVRLLSTLIANSPTDWFCSSTLIWASSTKFLQKSRLKFQLKRLSNFSTTHLFHSRYFGTLSMTKIQNGLWNWMTLPNGIMIKQPMNV